MKDDIMEKELNKSKRTRREKWTKESCITFLNRLIEQNKNLQPIAIRKQYSGFFHASNRIFGKYSNMFVEAGHDPNNFFCCKNKWNKHACIKYLQNLINHNEDISPRGLFENHTGFYHGALATFDRDLEQLYKLVGLSYCDVSRRKTRWRTSPWDKNSILHYFQETVIKGPLNPAYVCKHHKGFFPAVTRIYGSYRIFLEELGYNYENIKQHHSQDWSTERMREELEEIVIEYSGFTSGLLKQHYPKLYGALLRFFPSLSKAVKELGFDSYFIRKPAYDNKLFSSLGFLFEDIIEEILKEKQLFYMRNHSSYKGIFPDFNLGDGKWIDAKISNRAIKESLDRTVSRYEKKCSHLTLIYLVGEYKETISKKTNVIHVSTLLFSLPTHRQEYYKGKLDLIEHIYKNGSSLKKQAQFPQGK